MVNTRQKKIRKNKSKRKYNKKKGSRKNRNSSKIKGGADSSEVPRNPGGNEYNNWLRDMKAGIDVVNKYHQTKQVTEEELGILKHMRSVAKDVDDDDCVELGLEEIDNSADAAYYKIWAALSETIEQLDLGHDRSPEEAVEIVWKYLDEAYHLVKKEEKKEEKKKNRSFRKRLMRELKEYFKNKGEATSTARSGSGATSAAK